MTQKHCGYISIIGAPNAGKSTLLNQLTGSKLAIVTPKEQTTRHRITGICVHGKTQVIFLDTPGIFDATKKFEQAMTNSAWNAARDADLVLLLADVGRGTIAPRTCAIMEGLKNLHKPIFLALNKTDTMAKEKLLPLIAEFNDALKFEAIFPISALTGDGVREMLDNLTPRLPASPWLFPEDQMSDMPMRLLASEITREKIFMLLQQELPYATMVESEKWEERKDGSVSIHQIIYVEREGQKHIVIGKGGAMLKSIGEKSRRELTRLLDRTVHLFLHVKVKDWRNSAETYSYLGLE